MKIKVTKNVLHPDKFVDVEMWMLGENAIYNVYYFTLPKEYVVQAFNENFLELPISELNI